MWTFYAPSVDPTMGTSLPASPVDGQEFTLVDSMTAPTYSWKFRYVAAKASNKWVFVGGPPGHSAVSATESPSAAGSYIALATAGPSFTLPVAGDYMIGTGFEAGDGVNFTTDRMSFDIGATGAVDADAVRGAQQFGITSHARWQKKSGLTAVTMTAKYKSDNTTADFGVRWMSVVPIAVGG